MKNVNVRLYAILYKLDKIITEKLNEMKKAISNNANLTFEKYAKIQVVNCTRKSWSKEAQALADKYLTELGFEKQETNYTRIDIDNINEDIDNTVNNIINVLMNSNDNTIKRVASKK